MKKDRFFAVAALFAVGTCPINAAEISAGGAKVPGKTESVQKIPRQKYPGPKMIVLAPPDNSDAPTAEYDRVLELGEAPAQAIAVEAQAALHSSRFDRSIELARLSLVKNPDDIDTHRTYAEALEAKIQFSDRKDPALMRTCLLEWLRVLRSDGGEEKGVAMLGPGLWSHAFGDEERYGLARIHLKALVGMVPRPWESDSMYLKRAMQTKSSVRAKLIGSSE